MSVNPACYLATISARNTKGVGATKALSKVHDDAFFRFVIVVPPRASIMNTTVGNGNFHPVQPYILVCIAARVTVVTEQTDRLDAIIFRVAGRVFAVCCSNATTQGAAIGRCR